MKIFFGSIFVVIVLDQALKLLFLQTDYFPIYYNAGYAFSLSLPEPWHSAMLLVFYGLAWRFAIVMMRLGKRTSWDKLGAGLFLGGASSNLIDRMLRDGRVVDFIVVPYFSIFNIADVCITISVMLLVFAELRRSYGQSGQSENTVSRR